MNKKQIGKHVAGNFQPVLEIIGALICICVTVKQKHFTCRALSGPVSVIIYHIISYHISNLWCYDS